MAAWLLRSTLGFEYPANRVSFDLSRKIGGDSARRVGFELWPGILCCIFEQGTLPSTTVPLSIQVYIWVPLNLMLLEFGDGVMGDLMLGGI